MSAEPGVIAELEPDITSCWDYADDFRTPSASVKSKNVETPTR